MSEFDPTDVDALLARELSGFDPGTRYGNSSPIGGLVTNWRELSGTEAAERWNALRDWVEWWTTRYNIPVSVVPNCWWQHGNIVEELGRTGRKRSLGRCHRRQDIDIERHGLGRIAGLQRRAGYDHGDGIPDEAHLVSRQRVPDRLPHGCAVAVRQLDLAFQRAIALVVEIGGGVDRDDALHGFRVGSVDATNDAMRMRAADEGRMELALQRQIVGIAPFAAHKGRILVTRKRLADPRIDRRTIGLRNMHVHRKAPQSNESRSGALSGSAGSASASCGHRRVIQPRYPTVVIIGILKRIGACVRGIAPLTLA